MTMSSFDTLYEMDPAARAVAEIRAREAGMGFTEWLEALVYQQVAPTRRYHFYGGGPAVKTEPQGGSMALTTAIRPLANYDLDVAAYIPLYRFPELETLRQDPALQVEMHSAMWSALQTVSIFPPRISHAAILLSAAFAEAEVEFRLPARRAHARYKATSRWYHAQIDTCLHHSREVRNALMHRWTPTGRAERLLGDAFFTLCDLTAARSELLVLFHHDRSRASEELAKHLDVATQQFELSAKLLADAEASPSGDAADEHRFAQLRANLLEKAGGGLSLTQGAELLGVTRQALHKRIKAGTALGMMDGDEIVLPRLQFVEGGAKTTFVSGLSMVVPLFAEAGGWSALQFLIDPDPNLGVAPIEALRAGRADAVVDAARAYLGLDEG
jgi:hypothetical protein